jgi:hypothetical protein
MGATEPTPMQRLLELAKVQHEALERYAIYGDTDELDRARRLWEDGYKTAFWCRS